MNELHLFAGAGGGILGGQLLGHSTVCAVEVEEYPRQVLLQRQRDGVLPKFPIWDDVCTFDGKPWRGTVDVICGGFPCQDISSAGKGAGIAGNRSGLWKEYARIIDEVRPKFVFAENSPLLRGRGLDVVLGDLSELGYDAKWCVLGAWHVGAPHKRNRMWVLAYPNGSRRKQSNETMEGRMLQHSHLTSFHSGYVAHAAIAGTLDRDTDCKNDLQKRGICKGKASDASGVRKDVAHSSDKGLQGRSCTKVIDPEGRQNSDGYSSQRGGLWWENDPAVVSGKTGLLQKHASTEPSVGRMAHGVARRVDRLKAIGNGQVPAVAATAWNILSQ